MSEVQDFSLDSLLGEAFKVPKIEKVMVDVELTPKMRVEVAIRVLSSLIKLPKRPSVDEDGKLYVWEDGMETRHGSHMPDIKVFVRQLSDDEIKMYEVLKMLKKLI